MGQLGSEYSDLKNFKKKTEAALNKVRGVYPALKTARQLGALCCILAQPL
jgi:hypothetical protein